VTSKTAVIIVGAGGIGSALFQDLCRFLPHTIDIHLVDGDTVEGKNVQRQMFSKRHLDRNKAECLAETATTALGQDRIYYHAHYLENPKQLGQIAEHYDRVILVGCVDNHPARRIMEEFVGSVSEHEYFERDVYYIDCANEETRGEVVAVNVGVCGINGTFRSERDPSVLTDDHGDPLKASCTQQLDAGNVQVLYTNRTAAILALKLISYYLKGEVHVGICYFSDVHIDRLKVVDSGGSAEMVPPAGQASVD
jgi:hypothetical protein